MAVLKIGKFEIAQQSGAAGTVTNGVKYAVEHTGRNVYQKQARGVCGTDNAILDLSIAAKPPFMTLTSNSSDVAWDTINSQVTVNTNAEKFKVSVIGKSITLQSSSEYTVNGLIGTFTNNLGVDSQHPSVLTFAFATNTTAANVNIPILIEYWNGTAYVAAGTFTVTQSSADASIVITATPPRLPQYTPNGESAKLSITSNAPYTLEKQGGSIAWFTISRTTGVVGTADLTVTTLAQSVAAPIRTGSVVLKNPISGSTILTIDVMQRAGVPYEITITPAALAFTNAEINTIKNVTLTANAAWQIEEVIN